MSALQKATRPTCLWHRVGRNAPAGGEGLGGGGVEDGRKRSRFHRQATSGRYGVLSTSCRHRRGCLGEHLWGGSRQPVGDAPASRVRAVAAASVSSRGSQGYGRKGSTIVSINSTIHTIARNRKFSPILCPGQNALPMVWTTQLDEKTRV